ncbi:MAG TPA: lyase family protein, partial [Vicinamibacteria bacterium]
MAASAFDSFYLRDRYGSPEMRAIWDDRATIQRWLDVEAALARVQAELGIVPKAAARAIARAARVDRIDLRAMRREFDTTWNPVVPLVNALRARLPRRAAAWVHWGATSKNVIDTATTLQIKASCDVVLRQLDAVESAVARLARRHRDTLMAGRTHGQHALPVT